MDNEIGKLCREYMNLESRMHNKLAQLYPVGTDVSFKILPDQVNDSRGEVIAIEGGEYALLRVRLESRTRQVRSVSARDILP